MCVCDVCVCVFVVCVSELMKKNNTDDPGLFAVNPKEDAGSKEPQERKETTCELPK